MAVCAVLVAPLCASVVEVVNVTGNPLRFSALGGEHDAWVPANWAKRWMVPDAADGSTIVTYTVESLSGGTATSLGTFAVGSAKYYFAGYDGVSGFAANERPYDPSQVMQAGGYTTEDLVSWAKFGMLTQFGVEVAGLCLWALKASKRSWSSFLWGSRD